jgi:hypothetical protein
MCVLRQTTVPVGRGRRTGFFATPAPEVIALLRCVKGRGIGDTDQALLR